MELKDLAINCNLNNATIITGEEGLASLCRIVRQSWKSGYPVTFSHDGVNIVVFQEREIAHGP